MIVGMAGWAVAQDVELPAVDVPVVEPAPVPDDLPVEIVPAKPKRVKRVADEAPAPRLVPHDEWEIEIVPARSGKTKRSTTSEYQKVYASIPFSRAEWLANPSYRHDSAMALLTGQPINGRTQPNRQLEWYQDPRPYRRTFFPRLAPADLHYNYMYGRYQYRPWGWGPLVR